MGKDTIHSIFANIHVLWRQLLHKQQITVEVQRYCTEACTEMNKAIKEQQKCGKND